MNNGKYEPKWVIFDEASEITETMWRNLSTRYSHSQMQHQMQSGTWPLVRFVVTTSAARARRHGLFHWRSGFRAEHPSGKRPITWETADSIGAREWCIVANVVRRKNAPSLPVLRVFKVYLGTFRGQRFAVSELIY